MSIWRVVAILAGLVATLCAAGHRPPLADRRVERQAAREQARASRPEPGAGSDTLDAVPAAASARGPIERVVTGVLVAAGVAALAWGAVLLVTTERPDQWLGLLEWLVAAVVLHDGVFVPVVTVLNRAFGGLGRAVPVLVVWFVRVALIIGGIITLIVVPEIWAQSSHPGNPTVVMNDYGLSLAVFWLVTVVVTAAACVLAYLVARRRLPAAR